MDGHQEKEISNGIQAMAEMTTDAEPQDESQTAQESVDALRFHGIALSDSLWADHRPLVS